jgi:hypothetical protein
MKGIEILRVYEYTINFHNTNGLIKERSGWNMQEDAHLKQ